MMAPTTTDPVLGGRAAVAVFLAFAAAYFISALIRAVTATLAPVLSVELALQARDLGLLAGGYFLGFAAMQLPLGRWLDRFGPLRVILVFLVVAVLGCLWFAWADGFWGLLFARMLTGAGVSACLMAPLTGYRRWLHPAVQLRANAWMLMTGSLGMVASTLPVQWLLPWLGWRGLFVALAGAVVVAMVAIAWVTPRWSSPPPTDAGAPLSSQADGYAAIWRHRYFRKMLWVGWFCYGGMVAVQTLWVGPWLTRVAGASPQQAAQGLFGLNLCMLVAFWLWGIATPVLARRGWGVDRLIAWGLAMALVVLAAIVHWGPRTAWWHWALFCVCCSVGGLAQPAVALAFPARMAGRALSAYNLVIFAGVFVVQWGIGLLVDAFAALGWAPDLALRAAVGVFWAVCLASYLHFRSVPVHNAHP